MYVGKKPTLILEAIASKDLWIWHSFFFGFPGSPNEKNFLNRSDLFHDTCEGLSSPVKYNINGNKYDLGHYLADGIYPSYATLAKRISSPVTAEEKNFVKAHETVGKDVEGAFAVLLARFAMVRNPSKLWDGAYLGSIMEICIILHNIIVEDERELEEGEIFHSDFYEGVPAENSSVPREADYNFEEFVRLHCSEICDESIHQKPTEDLVEHLWQLRNSEQ